MQLQKENNDDNSETCTLPTLMVDTGTFFLFASWATNENKGAEKRERRGMETEVELFFCFFLWCCFALMCGTEMRTENKKPRGEKKTTKRRKRKEEKQQQQLFRASFSYLRRTMTYTWTHQISEGGKTHRGTLFFFFSAPLSTLFSFSVKFRAETEGWERSAREGIGNELCSPARIYTQPVRDDI